MFSTGTQLVKIRSSRCNADVSTPFSPVEGGCEETPLLLITQLEGLTRRPSVLALARFSFGRRPMSSTSRRADFPSLWLLVDADLSVSSPSLVPQIPIRCARTRPSSAFRTTTSPSSPLNGSSSRSSLTDHGLCSSERASFLLGERARRYGQVSLDLVPAPSPSLSSLWVLNGRR